MSDFDWGNTPKGQTKSSTSYIDRENLLREVYKKTANDRTIHIDCMASFVNLVNEQPTADVVEVVRCKDCAYHYTPLADCCGVPFVTNDDDFCSWGERREDGKIH